MGRSFKNLHIITRQIISLARNVLAALCLFRHIIWTIVSYRVGVGFIIVVHKCGRHGLHLTGRLLHVLHRLAGCLPRIRMIQRGCRTY